MSPILFYGVPEGCSFGSIVALEWSGLPYRLCRVEMPEMVSTDDYARINAVGETPSLLLEDGRTISESMAILHHIGAHAVGNGLGFPQGSEDFDRLNQMLAFLNTTFFKAFGPLWYAFEHPLEPREKQALTAYGIAAVEKAHQTLERLLEGREWLLGKRAWRMPISSASPAGTIFTRSSTAGSFPACIASMSACSRNRPCVLPMRSSISRRRKAAAVSAVRSIWPRRSAC
ncbi:hypothetical protein ACQY74_004924 [Rhizobium leguminosarum bv. trifolii]